MKIAIIGHKRIPSREGGIEVVVEELATRLAERGHQVTVYNRGGQHVSGKAYGRDISIQKGIYKGINIKTVPTIRKKGLAAVSGSFFGAVRATFGRYDVVHFHAEGPALFCGLPKLTGKRVIVTIHGLDHQRAKWGRFAKACIMGGEKAAVRHAHEIIVLSRDVQTYFQKRYGRKTVLIPNGVSKPSIPQTHDITERFRLEKDGYVLYLGRIVPEKGIRYLIQAFKGVQTDKKLVIAGGSSDTESYMQELKELAAGDDRILFTGFVQGSLLAELYANAYLYVLPSDLEGMPLSLLEAMSYGNCCLTSDLTECTEVTGESGLSFRKGDTADLKEKLQMLCDDPALVRQYRSNAADDVCSRFSWDKTVEMTEKLYSAAGSRRRNHRARTVRKVADA